MSKNLVLKWMVGGLALLLAAVQPAGAADPLPPVEQILAERSLGADDAPVTLVEYASLTCPHCASFHIETLPEIKSEYIETGKVRLVYKDFPLDRLALSAAMMARCGPPERYFGLLDVLFRSQNTWARASDPASELKRIGRLAGMTETTVEACLTNKAVFEGVMQARGEAQRSRSIESTPTFFLDGRKLSGDLPIEKFREAIDAALTEKNRAG